MIPDRRPTLLMVTVWARKGGAERLIVQLLETLSSEFRVALGYIRDLAPSARTLHWTGPEVGLREVLFERWDVVHTHLFAPGLAIRFRRLWDDRFRWVHTVHYHDYSKYRFGALKRWLDYRFIFPAVDALVAVSPKIHEQLSSRFPEIELVENAISLPDPPDRSRSGSDGTRPEKESAHAPPGSPSGTAPRNGPIIGTVAMLRQEKGLDDLLRATALLRKGHSDLRVRIAGEGNERDRLETLIRRLALEDTVELLGFVHDLDAFYASLDVYVQPSRTEVFGLAALEAMRFRLPVVVAGVDHLPELLAGGQFGAIVDRDGDFPRALCETLDRVLRDLPEYRERSERGLRHWRERLDPQAMDRSYREIYERVRLVGC